MGYVLIALVLAVLGAVVLLAGRWLRAIRELSRGLGALGTGRRTRQILIDVWGPIGSLIGVFNESSAGDPGPHRPAGGGPPAVARGARGHGRGCDRGGRAAAAAVCQHQRRCPVRARCHVGRPAGARADPQSAGAKRRRGDSAALPPRCLPGRGGVPPPRDRDCGARRGFFPCGELPCRAIPRRAPYWSSTT